MEKLLQDEIDESDKMNELGVRERVALNKKNQDLEQELFMKENQILLLNNQLDENSLDEKEVETVVVEDVIMSLYTEQLQNDMKIRDETISQNNQEMNELKQKLLGQESELYTTKAQCEEHYKKLNNTGKELISKTNTWKGQKQIGCEDGA